MVLSFVTLFGKNGLIHINILYSMKAVVLAHSFYNFPLILHTVYSAYLRRNVKCENEAATLGSKPLYTFFHLTLPNLRSAFLSSSLLVFMYAFSSFAIVLTLGGGVKNSTLEVEIYRNFKITMNKQLGTSYALVSFLFVLVLIVLYNICFKSEKVEKIESECKLKKGKPFNSFLAILFSIIILFPFINIVFSIFRNGFQSRGRSSKTIIERVFSNPKIFINSFLVAIISSLIVVFIAFIISEYNIRYTKKNKTFLSFLPLSISSIALSEGFISVATSSYILTLFSASLLNALFSFPLVYRIINRAASTISFSSLNAPLTLGGSVLKAVFSVDLPSVKEAIKRALGLSFSLSLGETSSAIMFSSYNFPTISSTIYSFISRYDYKAGSLLGVILLLLSAISIFIIIKEKSEN